jgi:hypothetical protein
MVVVKQFPVMHQNPAHPDLQEKAEEQTGEINHLHSKGNLNRWKKN